MKEWKGGVVVKKFLSFERMITPLIIQLFFWIGVISVVVSGFGMIIFGIVSKSGNFIQVIGGLATLFLGPILIRIYCEMLIVFFKMQSSLLQIKEILSEQQMPMTRVTQEEEL